jgi:hypothetical protein
LRIKKIRSDNGTKFKNSPNEGFLEEEGIKHEFSSPYTPQQNCVVERKNRTLLDMARTMLDEYKTLDQFWAEAINTACYSIKRLYLHRILKKTSYELLAMEQVDLDELDNEEAPCIVLRNISIGDVCTKESKEPPQAQDQPSSRHKHLHLLKMGIGLKKKRVKIKMMSHLRRRTLIKGEMKIITTRKMIKKFKTKDHRTQESTKQFKEITP